MRGVRSKTRMSERRPRIRRIVSGCQVGADEGGLIAGHTLGLETGGWMPRGHRTQAGSRPDLGLLYGLQTTPEWGYQHRTELNVQESDGTVRFAYDFDSPGERLTLRYIRRHGKPSHDITLVRPGYNPLPRWSEWDGQTFEVWAPDQAIVGFQHWLQHCQVETLNVAGNANPAIAQVVTDFLVAALTPLIASAEPAAAPANAPAATQLPLLP